MLLEQLPIVRYVQQVVLFIAGNYKKNVFETQKRVFCIGWNSKNNENSFCSQLNWIIFVKKKTNFDYSKKSIHQSEIIISTTHWLIKDKPQIQSCSFQKNCLVCTKLPLVIKLTTHIFCTWTTAHQILFRLTSMTTKALDRDQITQRIRL